MTPSYSWTDDEQTILINPTITIHMSHITQYYIENINVPIFFSMVYIVGCGARTVWDSEIVQLLWNKTKGTSIMASPGDTHGLIYIHIYPPGDNQVKSSQVK